MAATDHEQGRTLTIRLTAEQRARMKGQCGLDAEELHLTVEELEERITPRLAANHNETLLRL